jgi:hypothetical protein
MSTKFLDTSRGYMSHYYLSKWVGGRERWEHIQEKSHFVVVENLVIHQNSITKWIGHSISIYQISVDCRSIENSQTQAKVVISNESESNLMLFELALLPISQFYIML